MNRLLSFLRRWADAGQPPIVPAPVRELRQCETCGQWFWSVKGERFTPIGERDQCVWCAKERYTI